MAKTVIYATAQQAEKWGITYSEKVTLSRSDAKKLRNAFKDRENGQAYIIGIAATLIGGVFAKTAYAIAFGLSATTVTSLLSSKLESLDEVFDALATGENTYNKVKLTYKYKAYNGNDGAYYLNSVTIY